MRFFDGATLLGTATLSGDTATLLTGGLAAGSHSIEARYDGDASFDAGTQNGDARREHRRGDAGDHADDLAAAGVHEPVDDVHRDDHGGDGGHDRVL